MKYDAALLFVSSSLPLQSSSGSNYQRMFVGVQSEDVYALIVMRGPAIFNYSFRSVVRKEIIYSEIRSDDDSVWELRHSHSSQRDAHEVLQ